MCSVPLIGAELGVLSSVGYALLPTDPRRGCSSVVEEERLDGPQVIYLARHGETAWSLSGQHTGLTDLPLTERGECNARRLGERLTGLEFTKVYTSPLRRASRTCELAGFGQRAEVYRDLVEWHYGDYEGLRTADIHKTRPDWEPFRDGFPGGETFDQIGARADRVVNRVRSIDGAVLLFSSAHFLRVLAARWLGLQPQAARYFLLGTASVSTLTYEHNPSEPAIGLWNDTRHVSAHCGEESK
jgi:broad specificity phosphatase PhoE